jgi:hypothetical protein
MKRSEISEKYACEVCYGRATTFVQNTGDKFINFESDEVELELSSEQAIPICHKCLGLIPKDNLKELSYTEWYEKWLRDSIEDGMEWVKCSLDDIEFIRSYCNELFDKYVAESVMNS